MTGEVVVVGAGVIGVATAYHLARLGARRVLLVDERADVASGTSAQSSAIPCTHYSVPGNVALAQRSLAVFQDFKAYLGDAEADCGFNRCGYLIVAGEAKAGAVRACERRGCGPARPGGGAEMGAKSALGIGAACACVGFVLGIATLTGVGFKFSAFVVSLSGDVAVWVKAFDSFGLLFTAVACIIMGSGVPTTPT